MKFIVGKKIEMSQVWKGDKFMAVTKVAVMPAKIVQLKTEKKDGYTAVQVGFGTKKIKNINKPQIGHMKDLGNFADLKEFRIDASGIENVAKGDVLDISMFAVGEVIKATGISKGKGFQGVVKRHGFSGQKATHGNKDQERASGSVGPKGPAQVFKGTKMGGRMGGDQVSVTNLTIAEIDSENNLILLNGSVPGGRNALVYITAKGDLKIVSNKTEKAEEKIEEAVEVAAETAAEEKVAE